tara:strand:- start:7443 stop:7670 length:228 start_codon:yes stop_codon:yes gene_type:complete
MIDLDKEIKKLNYALGSYPCGYSADYELDDRENILKLMLMDSGDMPVLELVTASPISINEMNGFKSRCIKKCSHA